MLSRHLATSTSARSPPISPKDPRPPLRTSAIRPILIALSLTLSVGLLAFLLLSHSPSLLLLSFASWLPSQPSSPSIPLSLHPHSSNPSLPPPPSLADVQRDPTLAFAPHPSLKPTPEWLSTLPSRCGQWMAPYISFHNAVSSGLYFVDAINRTGSVPVLPLSVYRVDPEKRLGGISDRWPPLSTALLVSVLTQRALFIDWPGYEEAYTHSHLPYLTNTTWREVYHNWRWYQQHIDDVKAALSAHRTPPSPPRVADPYNISVPMSDVVDTGTHDNGLTFEGGKPTVVIEQLTSAAQLRALYHPELPVVWMTQAFWSKGLLTKFFNSNLRYELWEMGLREATCHGCMINLLMSINRRVMELFAPYALRLRQPGLVTIGLQIRLGDVAMTGKALLTDQNKKDTEWLDDDARLLRYTGGWTNCAQQLLDLHATTVNQSHLLFLVADSVKLRAMLEAQLGPRLLVVHPEGQLKVGHTDVGDPLLFNGTLTQLSKDSAGDYLRMAAGEQWLLAYCDYLVIEHMGSGFGRSASFRSVKVGHTWNARGRQRCDGDTGHLTVKDFDIFGHRY